MGKDLIQYKMLNQVKKRKEKHTHAFHCEYFSQQKPNYQITLNPGFKCDFHLCNLSAIHPHQILSSSYSTGLIRNPALAMLFSVSLCASKKAR